MIKHFNFYDVYGYVIPGLTLMALLWLPYGLAVEQLPVEDLASALLGLVIAYVVGHLLQILGQQAFPSGEIDEVLEKRRHPSDYMLDENDTTFSASLRASILEAIQKCFQLDVSDKTTGGDPGRRQKLRDDAFRLCRATLIQGNKASYSEQFQGMYVLMRGLMAAFVLASGFQLAWAFESVLYHFIDISLKVHLIVASSFAALLILGCCVVAKWLKKWPNAKSLWLPAMGRLLLFFIGWAIALGVFPPFGAVSDGEWKIMLLLFFSGLFLIALVPLCRGSHRTFAKLFAAEVYRSFLVLVDCQCVTTDGKGRPNDGAGDEDDSDSESN